MTDDDVQARLAAQLKELRDAAGLGGIEAGQRAGISQSKISKLERQALRPDPDDVRTLCEVYGASNEQQQEMVRAARSLRSDAIIPARVTLSRGAHHMQQRIARLEESAVLLRSFQNAMVIGLVQTEAYARIVFGAAVGGPELDQAVAARMARQAQLRERVPQAVLIMTEGALRWMAGSPQVMISQIDAINEAIDLPNVEIGIVPFSVPATFFPRHGWHLYDSDAVIIGTEAGTAVITDRDDITRHEDMFADVRELAAMGPDARPVLNRIASDYRALQR